MCSGNRLAATTISVMQAAFPLMTTLTFETRNAFPEKIR
jgi:hypothetical protein